MRAEFEHSELECAVIRACSESERVVNWSAVNQSAQIRVRSEVECAYESKRTHLQLEMHLKSARALPKRSPLEDEEGLNLIEITVERAFRWCVCAFCWVSILPACLELLRRLGVRPHQADFEVPVRQSYGPRSTARNSVALR